MLNRNMKALLAEYAWIVLFPLGVFLVSLSGLSIHWNDQYPIAGKLAYMVGFVAFASLASALFFYAIVKSALGSFASTILILFSAASIGSALSIYQTAIHLHHFGNNWAEFKLSFAVVLFFAAAYPYLWYWAFLLLRWIAKGVPDSNVKRFFYCIWMWIGAGFFFTLERYFFWTPAGTASLFDCMIIPVSVCASLMAAMWFLMEVKPKKTVVLSSSSKDVHFHS